MKQIFKKHMSNKMATAILCSTFILIIATISSIHTKSPLTASYGNNFGEYVKATFESKKMATEAQKVCKGASAEEVHQYISNLMAQYSYDDSLSNASIYDGMKNGQMICRGFAAFSRDIWEACGYEAYIVVGYRTDDVTDETRSDIRQHAWTKVVLDDNTEMNFDYTTPHPKFKDDLYLSKAYTVICNYDGTLKNKTESDRIYENFVNSKVAKKNILT